MKLFFIECDAEELKSNRGLMDAITDACRDVLGSLCGSYSNVILDSKNGEEDESEETNE